MTATITQTFPAYHDVVQELVEEHLELTQQQLLLALYYASEHEPNDVFLFEVADGFGGNWISEDSELMEVTFGAGTGLQIDNDQRLHLTLTNPREFDAAVQRRWEGLQEVVYAVQSGRCRTIHAAPEIRGDPAQCPPKRVCHRAGSGCVKRYLIWSVPRCWKQNLTCAMSNRDELRPAGAP